MTRQRKTATMLSGNSLRDDYPGQKPRMTGEMMDKPYNKKGKKRKIKKKRSKKKGNHTCSKLRATSKIVNKKRQEEKPPKTLSYSSLIYLLTNNDLSSNDTIYIPIVWNKISKGYIVLDDLIINSNVKLRKLKNELNAQKHINPNEKYFILVIPKQSWDKAINKHLVLEKYYSISKREVIGIRCIQHL